MVATVRLSSELEEVLNGVAEKLHKKKSDVIRDAISFYAKSLDAGKKSRIQNAVAKTQEADFLEYKNMESSLDDGL
jgi:predicted transcriptional regulator